MKKKEGFISLLGEKFLSLDENQIQAAFCSAFSYDLKPYGGTTSTDLGGLLSAETFHCGNYCTLTQHLFRIISPDSDANLVMIGWDGDSALTSHTQLIIGGSDGGALLLDPTVNFFANVDSGLSGILSGNVISVNKQTSLLWRDDNHISNFSKAVSESLTGGDLRVGNLLHWFEGVDYWSNYGYMHYPTPQRESIYVNGREGYGSHDPVNGGWGALDGAVFVGGPESNNPQIPVRGAVVFGGADFKSVGVFEEFLKSSSNDRFFSDEDLNLIKNNIQNIDVIFESKIEIFRFMLGEKFDAVPSEYIILAFSGILAHEIQSPGSTSVGSLAELMSAGGLDVDGFSLLTWYLYQELSPNSSANLGMVGWYNGHAGRSSQIMISLPGEARSFLFDAMYGVAALVGGLNELAAGEAVPLESRHLFYVDGALSSGQMQITRALDEGRFRGSDLLYWFATPNDVEFFMNDQPNWATPQGNPYRSGTAPLAALGNAASEDRLESGAGSVLVGDGFARNMGQWTSASSGSEAWYVGDFNGDGRSDLLGYSGDHPGANVLLAGIGEFSSEGNWTQWGHGAQPWHVGDFNGDGMDDIFRIMPGGVQMLLSTGDYFSPAGAWTQWGAGAQGWYIGDFNGDGMDDIFRLVHGVSGAQMLLSNGAYFAPDGSWTSAGSGDDGWYIGDFDGDGKDDIARTLPTGLNVWLSTGSAFVDNGIWTTVQRGALKWTVADVNGDGRADLIGDAWASTKASVVLLSTGAGFRLTGDWAPLGQNGLNWAVGDFNGDGMADFAAYQVGGEATSVLLNAGIGNYEDDIFVLRAGETQGTYIADFQGASRLGGDQLWFQGFGSSNDVILSHVGDTWTVHNIYNGHSENFRLTGVTQLGRDDFFFS